ncbi:MAG: type II toxin-antitoxin system VapC family toxin [Actinobacteria bacterium]|nr:type II toxin-antitoxin system VapC family toxin [Actinomycetota bacterium]
MRLLVDTQVLIWEVLDPARLSPAASAAIDREIEDQEPLGVSAFSLVEIAYAVEKASNPMTSLDRDRILLLLRDAEAPFEVLPVDMAVAAQVGRVPRSANADPGDRIIVATVEVHGLGLISADRKIPGMTKQEVIW